jgi:5-enolpyruvylshikimate-3-phosphate synthase
MEKNSLDSKKNTNNNQEINVTQLIEKARRYITECDYSNAEYYINLALLSHEIDYSLRIQAMGNLLLILN